MIHSKQETVKNTYTTNRSWRVTRAFCLAWNSSIYLLDGFITWRRPYNHEENWHNPPKRSLCEWMQIRTSRVQSGSSSQMCSTCVYPSNRHGSHHTDTQPRTQFKKKHQTREYENKEQLTSQWVAHQASSNLEKKHPRTNIAVFVRMRRENRRIACRCGSVNQTAYFCTAITFNDSVRRRYFKLNVEGHWRLQIHVICKKISG